MINKLFSSLQQEASQSNHRRLLVVSGSYDWCCSQALLLQQQAEVHWITNNAPAGVNHYLPSQSHKLLGSTITNLLLNAWEGFNPDYFGQISGTLAGGSIMILLCPPLASWGNFDDPEHQRLVTFPFKTDAVGRRFITRFIKILVADPSVCFVTESASNTQLKLEKHSNYTKENSEIDYPFKTKEQQLAVKLVVNQFQRGRRPVVLIADRGRGKTAALGIAATKLHQQGFKQIFITAPNFNSVEVAFKLAALLLPDAVVDNKYLESAAKFISFISPEMALQQTGKGQILLVDEAAAIPVSLLTKLLKRFPRIVFASTVHGYEGTGQGFRLRFQPVLDSLYPKWKQAYLQQPVRWNVNDPLEALVFKALLLNAESVALPLDFIPAELNQLAVERLDRDKLVLNEADLNQLFGLLICAHYKTTPADLRILLDSPNLVIKVIRIKNKIIAAALLVDEGPLPESLIEDIWIGRRRPRGHLIPQTLVSQEGIKSAACLKAKRIMRIAVQPDMQNKGIGSYLVQKIIASTDVDYLGASFAASARILHFWQRQGLNLIRIGYQQEQVSGQHAVLAIMAKSPSGLSLQKLATSRFIEQLHYRLSDDLQQLSPDIVCALLRNTNLYSELTEKEFGDLYVFAHYHRSYESVITAIRRLLINTIAKADNKKISSLLADNDFCLLIARNLQQVSWQELENFSQGRRGLSQQLRLAVQKLIA